jgi:hypothetical protein
MPTLRLTYDELGERIGRSAEAARGLARRRHWQTQKGNDGQVRVILDERELDGWQPRARPDASGHERSRPDGREQLLEALMAARERAASAEGEATALRATVADLSRRLDAATAELAELRQP